VNKTKDALRLDESWLEEVYKTKTMKNNIKNLIVPLLLLLIIFSTSNRVSAKVSKNDNSKEIELKVTKKTVVKTSDFKVAVPSKELKPIVKSVPVQVKTKAPVAPSPKTPIPTPVGDKEYIKRRICEVFVEDCASALIIAFHESGYRTEAISRTNDYGVFQLNCKWQKKRVGGDCNRFLDLETNLRVAHQIYKEQGWKPWSTKIYLRK
jgi:hypothetical protein